MALVVFVHLPSQVCSFLHVAAPLLHPTLHLARSFGIPWLCLSPAAVWVFFLALVCLPFRHTSLVSSFFPPPLVVVDLPGTCVLACLLARLPCPCHIGEGRGGEEEAKVKLATPHLRGADVRPTMDVADGGLVGSAKRTARSMRRWAVHKVRGWNEKETDGTDGDGTRCRRRRTKCHGTTSDHHDGGSKGNEKKKRERKTRPTMLTVCTTNAR